MIELLEYIIDIEKDIVLTPKFKILMGKPLSKDELTFNKLYLKNSKIKKLPDNLRIEGSLHLQYSEIEVLPKNLYVRDDINLYMSKIKTLPSDMYVGQSLHCHNSTLESLPDNLTINGSLDISETNIKKLPKNLRVKRKLYLINIYLKLSDDLDVGESICVSPDMFDKYMSKNIKFRNKIEYWPYI